MCGWGVGEKWSTGEKCVGGGGRGKNSKLTNFDQLVCPVDCSFFERDLRNASRAKAEPFFFGLIKQLDDKDQLETLTFG